MIYRILIGLVVAAILFVSGFYTGRGQREIQTVERVIRGETEIVEKIITREKIVHPDGTVTEREIVEDKKTSEKQSESLSETKSKSILSNYSVGIRYWMPISQVVFERDTHKINNLEINLGRRLVGDIWVDAGYRLDNSVSLGFSAKF